MTLVNHKKAILAAAIAAMASTQAAHAFTFANESGSVSGSLDSTVATGFGYRLGNPDCALTGDPNSSCGTSANVDQWSNGDNGNLNYRKGDFFAAYIKGSHDLLLKFPDQWKFMARGAWSYDFKATDTARTDFESDAEKQTQRQTRLFDLWVSKDFALGDQNARVRLGNQVINWGESIFFSGGINVTNALDLQKLLTPGTQIKEAYLAAPMVSFATGLGNGFNVDAYYQFRWNRNVFPAVGSYFSASDIVGKGKQPVYFSNANFNLGGQDAESISGSRNVSDIKNTQQLIYAGNYPQTFGSPMLDDVTPKNSGQYGIAVHKKLDDWAMDVGFYFINYHDKFPVLSYQNNATFPYHWSYLENRKLYGISMNKPIGNWAVGAELSYRPKDAIALSTCFNQGGATDARSNLPSADFQCDQWADEKKYELHLTAQLQLTPGDYGTILNLFKADTAYLTAEGVFVRYPGVKADKVYNRNVNGVDVAQIPMTGYAVATNPSGYPVDSNNAILTGFGSQNSGGIAIDYNWTYDSKLIKGWLVTPGVTYYQAFKDQPVMYPNYLNKAKSANYYVLFASNPATWQAGLNYTVYWGGDQLRQAYGDRDFIGGFISRNF